MLAYRFLRSAERKCNSTDQVIACCFCRPYPVAGLLAYVCNGPRKVVSSFTRAPCHYRVLQVYGVEGHWQNCQVAVRLLCHPQCSWRTDIPPVLTAGWFTLHSVTATRFAVVLSWRNVGARDRLGFSIWGIISFRSESILGVIMKAEGEFKHPRTWSLVYCQKYRLVLTISRWTERSRSGIYCGKRKCDAGSLIATELTRSRYKARNDSNRF